MMNWRERLLGITRHHLVLGLLALATAGIVLRAVFLQLLHNDFLQEQGNERFLREVQVPAHRGMILDRNDEPLAVSSPVDSIWVNPKLVLQYQEQLSLLAPLVGTSTRELTQKLNERQDREFVYLRRHLPPDIAQRIINLDIPGVYTQREYRRYYPTAEVTSHLLGFTDVDDIGQEGLELGFNGQLQGKPGQQQVIQDRLGRVVENVGIERMPEPGKPLTLSIDQRIQYLAYRALKAAVQERLAAGASAVVIDVTTGEILAMVNQPAGNPNDRQQLNAKFLRNRAVTDIFEPGSTLKPFTVALGLESGAYKPETLINTNPGHLQIGRYTVRDVHNYGTIDVSRVISKSSNIGTSKIALSLPREKLWTLLTQVGFGAETKLGFAGEQRGILRHYRHWDAITHANHSFGYGLSVTALQLAQAYTVLAADGIRRPLSITRVAQPPEGVRVLSVATTRKLRIMLEAAVSKEGTGFKANVGGYRVAGKTGTARKVVNRRYSTEHYLSLFAGMVPASRPRLVGVIIVDDARRGGYYGGTIAAPVFSAIMTGALRILNVAPDSIPTTNLLMASQEPEPKR